MDQNQVLDNIEQVLAGMSTDQIKEFITAAKARAAAARRANSKQAKKEDARRLILDGKLLADMIAQGLISADIVAAARDKFLTRNADRQLFGLPEIDEIIPPKKRRGRPPKNSDPWQPAGHT